MAKTTVSSACDDVTKKAAIISFIEKEMRCRICGKRGIKVSDYETKGLHCPHCGKNYLM